VNMCTVKVEADQFQFQLSSSHQQSAYERKKFAELGLVTLCLSCTT
jgi:hypothetical protein